MNATSSIAQGVVTQDVSPAELYQVMTGATSSDPNQIQASAKRFKEMLQQSGVFDALHQIAAERSVPLPVRQQASIQFKNEALKAWKSRKVQNDAHRVAIRSRMLVFLDEEDETIAKCMQLSVGRIARSDYPDQWPSLITDLLNVLDQGLTQRYNAGDQSTSTAIRLQRALQMLRAVIKELSAMKMLGGIKSMARVVEQLHETLYTYFTRLSSAIPVQTSDLQQSPNVFMDLLLTDLVYKSLSSVASWLWQRNEKLGQAEAQLWVFKVFDTSAEQLKVMISWRSSIINSNGPQTSPLIDRLTKHIRHLGKFFRRVCALSPKRFVDIPHSADVVLFYWNQITQAANSPPGSIDDSNYVLYPVRFLVQGMVMFKDTLGQYTAVRRDGTPNKNTLSQEFVQDAVKLIVTRFLPLNAKDLEGWLADPEEWVNTEETENEHWEYELRACSERVLLQVSNQYPDYVAPLLQSTFVQVAEQAVVDLDSTLQKEALYCAIGRCCRRLKDDIQFIPWIENTLTTEARDTKGSAPILKRRIAWLLGKLMSDECIDPNHPRIWEILVHLLGDRGQGTDAVVRLTAGVAIREGVDTLEFKLDSFKPYLASAATEMMNLIGEVDSFDSKRRVDDALNVVIERAGAEMVPIVPAIVGPLPALWMEAGTNWLFKNSLLVTMTNLVKAIGPHSTSLSATIVPLIDESMNEGMNLDSDGALLWKEAMRCTTSATAGNPPLSNLLPLAIRLLETNLDLLGSILNIMESYFLLNGEQILQMGAVELFGAFLSIFTRNALRENQKGALTALHLLIQTTPSPLWAEALHTSGLFPYLLKNLIENETDAIILSHEIYLFSRIVMSNPQSFTQLMAAAAPQINLTEAKAYELLMDQWWAQFDAMSEPRHRKLVAMGMTALVSTGRPDVLQRLPTEIFNLWLDVFGEIREARRDPSEFEGDETPANTLQRHWEQDEAPDEFYQDSQNTPEYERRKRVWDGDPVRMTKLSAYVADGLRAAEAMTGSQNFHDLYLSKTDPAVLMQIQSEIANA